jgi:hypothetical protein
MATEAQIKRFFDTWTCCVCTEIPVEPFQTPCAHRTCLECAKKLGAKKKVVACPICREEFLATLIRPQPVMQVCVLVLVVCGLWFVF